MKRISRKMISFVVVIALCATTSIPVFADEEIPSKTVTQPILSDELLQVFNTNAVKFQKVSDTELIYTYERDNVKYKNIDTFVSSNVINTEVYAFGDDKYSLVDTIVYVIDGNTMTEISSLNGFASYSTLAAANHNWKYQSSFNGNTSFRNQSIAAIAAALAGLFGGIPGAFFGVASVIFSGGIKTVYYKVNLYKDLNSPRLRPIFKKETYLYKDEAHKKPLPGNPVITIIKP